MECIAKSNFPQKSFLRVSDYSGCFVGTVVLVSAAPKTDLKIAGILVML